MHAGSHRTNESHLEHQVRIAVLQHCSARTDSTKSVPAYDFLNQDPAPDTVNPSLWRMAQLNMNNGLFKVCDRVYQLRGMDLANMTIIECDSGLIIIDPRRIDLVRTPHIEADYHLQLRPGTNVAVMNAIAHVVVTEGFASEDYIRERFQEFRDKERPDDYGRDLAPDPLETQYAATVSIEPSPSGDLIAAFSLNRKDGELDIVLLSATTGEVVSNLTDGFNQKLGFESLGLPLARFNQVPWMSWSPVDDRLAYFVRKGKFRSLLMQNVVTREVEGIRRHLLDCRCAVNRDLHDDDAVFTMATWEFRVGRKPVGIDMDNLGSTWRRNGIGRVVNGDDDRIGQVGE